jgi:hypothetical protein
LGLSGRSRNNSVPQPVFDHHQFSPLPYFVYALSQTLTRRRRFGQTLNCILFYVQSGTLHPPIIILIGMASKMVVVKPATGKANRIHTRKFIGQSSVMVSRDIGQNSVTAPSSTITVKDLLTLCKKIASTEVDDENKQKQASPEIEMFHEFNKLLNGSQYLFGPYFF